MGIGDWLNILKIRLKVLLNKVKRHDPLDYVFLAFEAAMKYIVKSVSPIK